MRAFLLLVFALFCLNAPLRAQGKAAPVSGARYREILEAARQNFLRVEKRAPRDVRPTLRSLERDFLIRRSDGQTLSTSGTFWERELATRNAKTLGNLPRRDVRVLRQKLELQIRAFDAWNTPRDGAYFLPADAKTIVKQLEKSGEIRVGPLWWQNAIANVRAWIGSAWEALLKWIGGLFPTRAPSTGNVPSFDWLMPLFWLCVVALLATICFFALRALGALEWFSREKRRKKTLEELEGEDAALLRLPADELRDRAHTFASAGNFREALRHRFLAVLVECDARGVWRYDTRRTNWEHLEKLGADARFAALVDPLSGLTRRFDRVRYGGAPCDQENWRVFETDASALEATLPREVAGVTR